MTPPIGGLQSHCQIHPCKIHYLALRDLMIHHAPSPPPAAMPVQAPGSPMTHWYVASGTPPWISRGYRLYGGHLYIQDHLQWQGELFPQGEFKFQGERCLRLRHLHQYSHHRQRRPSHHRLLRLFKHWTRMMMKTLQRTSQCQHSHCCLLVVRELLPLLTLKMLLRLRSCLLRLLLRHLIRLCLLRLPLMHLLKVRLLRLPRRLDSVTLSRSSLAAAATPAARGEETEAAARRGRRRPG